MSGLVWLIQLVHYPMFALVPPSVFEEYEMQHQRRIAPLVVPAMLMDLASSWAVALSPDPLMPWWLQWALPSLTVGTWLSTFLLSVPCHNHLSKVGYDAATIRRLVATNWPRNLMWTLKSALCLWWLA